MQVQELALTGSLGGAAQPQVALLLCVLPGLQAGSEHIAQGFVQRIPRAFPRFLLNTTTV